MIWAWCGIDNWPDVPAVPKETLELFYGQEEVAAVFD